MCADVFVAFLFRSLSFYDLHVEVLQVPEQEEGNDGKGDGSVQSSKASKWMMTMMMMMMRRRRRRI
jgi:hypothetical protein